LIAISNPAPEGGSTFSLSSSRPEIASVPKSVTIPAKGNSARFPILTRPVTEDKVTVQISMASGEMRRANTLAVYPCMPPFTLSAQKVVGGTAVVGTVSLPRPAAGEGITVKIASDKPSLASMPSEVKVPAGSSRAAFQISTRSIASEAATAITVSQGGCMRTAVLTVSPL